jgi:uncharacterized protein (DUF362 family)/Pyruvate/2-oxoacid:ferredoxin oxidoreductase delta subunit
MQGSEDRQRKGPSMRTQVSLARCDDYDPKKVFDAVSRSVDLLGGIGSFIKPGERVLIKPNLLKGRPPDDAVTTHPEIVRAVIRLVHGTGAKAYVGDSPGIGDLRKVAERSGILSVIEQEGATLAEFDEAVSLKGPGRFQRFEIARAAVEADAIINLPKLKTHGMTVLTGAVKNLFGCVPGKRKVQWHFNAGVDHDSFTCMLVELTQVLRPRLTVMDAIIGMEGNGPGSGDPRRIGLVLAGQDPVAVDVVSGNIVGLAPEEQPVIRAALKAGIGASSLEDIEVLGEDLSGVSVKEFRLPPHEHTEWQLPDWARRRLKDALTTRPVIDHHSCVECGICLNDCPQKAITSEGGKLNIDYRRCIRCFCCQEFCPQGAITVGRGWLLKLIP